MWLAKGGPTIKDIELAIQAAIKEYDIKWVMLDSLSNVHSPHGGIYEDTRAASKGVQRLAKEYPVAIVQTVQIGRSSKDRANKSPGIHDSKGGSDVEEDTDVLIGLYNHHAYVRMGIAEESPDYPEGMVVARINKNKQKGTLGQAAKLRLIDGVGMWEAELIRVDLSA
jgi:replicative DNA helicase